MLLSTAAEAPKHTAEAADAMWVRPELETVLQALLTPLHRGCSHPLDLSWPLSLTLTADCVIKSEDQTEVSPGLLTRVESQVCILNIKFCFRLIKLEGRGSCLNQLSQPLSQDTRVSSWVVSDVTSTLN